VVNLWTAPESARSFDHILGRTPSLTLDGRTQLILSYHFLGSGADLSYDIVDRDQGSIPRVVAHRGPLSHGLASLSGRGNILEFEAKYPSGEANCCPAYFQESLLQFGGGGYVLSPVTHVGPNSVPPGSF
jgi:hypothetical protein